MPDGSVSLPRQRQKQRQILFCSPPFHVSFAGETHIRPFPGPVRNLMAKDSMRNLGFKENPATGEEDAKRDGDGASK